MFRIDLRRLVLGLSLLSVLLALGTSFYASYQAQRDLLLNNALEGNRAYAAKLARLTEQFNRSARQQLAYAARQLTDMDSHPDKMLAEAARLQRQSGHFNSVLVVRANGRIAAMAPMIPEILGDRLDIGPPRGAMAHMHSFLSEPFAGATGRWMVLYSEPIFDSAGQYSGYIAGVLYLHENPALYTLLGEHCHRDGSFLVVVDRAGRFIYHPERARIGQSVAGTDLVGIVTHGSSGQRQLRNSRGELVLAGYAVAQPSGWGLVSQRPVARTSQRLEELFWSTLRNALPLLILLLLCIWWLSKLIVRPLRELVNAARQIDDVNVTGRLRQVKSWYLESTQLKRALINGVSTINHKMRQLRRESTTDPLTSLLNRRGLSRAMEMLSRAAVPVAVAVIDIDNFKSINDRFGHDAGDTVIRNLAALMRERARASDALARQGGEEFSVLFPATSLEDATGAVERLRQAIQAAVQPTGQSVTISIGVARYPDHGGTLEAVFKAADQALYEAKRNGRNRTCVAATALSDPAHMDGPGEALTNPDEARG